MFSIKTVTTYPNTKQINESVIEVEEYDITKFGHGVIDITFPDKKFSMIRLSKVENRRDGIFERSVFISNSNGKTIDKLHPSDFFDTSMTNEEWKKEDERLISEGK